MGILEELWCDNLSSFERDCKKGSTYSELLEYIVRHEEVLQKRMNDEEKEIFEKSSPSFYERISAHFSLHS